MFIFLYVIMDFNRFRGMLGLLYIIVFSLGLVNNDSKGIGIICVMFFWIVDIWWVRGSVLLFIMNRSKNINIWDVVIV